MFPTASPTQLSSATAFCRTYTTTVNTNTAITQFPTRATSACGSSPSKYSSICSCGVPPSPSPTCSTDTAANLLRNSDFECGLSPWTTYTIDGTTTSTLSSPGYNSATAFQFTIGSTTSPSDATARLIQTVYNLEPDATYTLTFATNIAGPDAGFWGVMINGQPKRTVDARDNLGPGVWNVNSFDFVDDAAAVTEVKFEVITSQPGSVFKLDKISLVKKSV